MKEYQDGWTIRLITRPGLKERLEPPTCIEDLLAPPGTVCCSMHHGLSDRQSAIECLRLTIENELEALNYSESKSQDSDESVAQLRQRQRIYLSVAQSIVKQAIQSS